MLQTRTESIHNDRKYSSYAFLAFIASMAFLGASAAAFIARLLFAILVDWVTEALQMQLSRDAS